MCRESPAWGLIFALAHQGLGLYSTAAKACHLLYSCCCCCCCCYDDDDCSCTVLVSGYAVGRDSHGAAGSLLRGRKRSQGCRA